MKYKVRTVNIFWCHSPDLSLAELKKQYGRYKIIVTYGENAKIIIPQRKEFIVVNISRDGKDYKAFANYYKVVA
jgi:hypothetical protein